ncbi:MAG: AMP-binding protein, partial [Nitrospira sp.]|nr:AMP-binding protein [Nitrospira sp.]
RPNVESGDDFFALGGDSLRGLQVVARVREVRGLDVPLDALFDHPTLAAFSAHVETCLPADPGAPIESIRRVSRDETLPLSFAQERFWFLDQLSSGSSINNIPVALRLVGALDVEALRRSLDEIIQRHEILRACFALRNGRPSHIIVPQLILALDIEDLRTSVEPDRDAQILRLAGEEACRPFDLANGPLIRGCLFRLDDMNHVLSLTLHHIVADGWSMDVLRRELASLYEAFKDGRPSPLPVLSIQYVDLIAAQRERPKGAADRRLLEYWANQLEGAPPLLNLPWDYPRPAIQGHRGARHPWTLEPELARRLYEVGARYRATPFMLLVSALGLLLSRYSRQTDFCIGTPVANRAGCEAEQLVGCFVNTVALRMDVSGNPSLPALLDRVRVMVLGAQSHQDLSFERLVDELGVVRDLGHTPLFQVMFVLEDSPSDVRRFADLEASRLNVGTGTSVFDLTLEMAQKTDGSLDAVFEYSTDLFAADTIARMAGHLQALLRQIVASPEASVSELSILSPGEQALELADSRSPREAYPQEASLHRLIEAQASKTPDAVALQCDRGPITYDSLNRLGNQLARYLRVQGIVPEAPVALCVDRSLEMAIGLLGCLKAGATYVPVDPSYPAERQAAIFRDAQPHLLLTQGRHLESLPEHTAPVLALDAGWPAVAGLPDDNLVTGPNPDHLAYLLYTSGTTGNPKGIGITHRALVNHGLAMVQAYDLSPADRVLQFASVSFDVAAEECFPTWLAGATVVLRPNEPVPAYGDFQAFLH